MSDFPRELEPLVADIMRVVERALEKSFEVGRAAGVVDGEASLRRQLVSVLNKNDIAAPQPSILGTSGLGKPLTAPPATKGQRAPKGSVRPAILAALSIAGSVSSTPEELLGHVHQAGHTLIKAETIRSTLHKLAKDHAVRKDGNGWVLTNEGKIQSLI